MLLNSAGNYCRYAVLLAASFFISSPYAAETQPRPRSLSEFSNEEIVAEYHSRLDAIFEKTIEPGTKLVSLPSQTSDILTKELEEQGKILQAVAEELKPYAEAGNVYAAAMVGGQFLNGPTRTRSERCRGIKLLNQAAMEGYSGAAFALYAHFDMRHRFSDDEYFAKLSYFWANEAARYAPAFRHSVKAFDVTWSSGTLVEWSKDLQNWLPSEDKSVQNEIRLVCASAEKASE